MFCLSFYRGQPRTSLIIGIPGGFVNHLLRVPAPEPPSVRRFLFLTVLQLVRPRLDLLLLNIRRSLLVAGELE